MINYFVGDAEEVKKILIYTKDKPKKKPTTEIKNNYDYKLSNVLR